MDLDRRIGGRRLYVVGLVIVRALGLTMLVMGAIGAGIGSISRNQFFAGVALVGAIMFTIGQILEHLRLLD